MVVPAPTGDAVAHEPATSRGQVDNVSTVTVTADAPGILPSGQFASDAAYRQQGDDLVLTTPDGKSVIVEGYFRFDPPPDLLTPEGGRLTPAMVDSFTPPEAVGQYAQAGQLAQAAEPIGQVSDLTGRVFAVRADGTRVQLAAGDAVFQGDVVETAGGGGAVNLVFLDNTTFALGADARLALDEMVYNPATQAGSSSFSVLKGVFVFVSGQIAKTDNTQMTVSTPVATIGIRGTKVAGEVKPAGEESKFTVIDGEIAVATQGGFVVMSDANATTSVTSFSAPPSAPVILSQSQIDQSYSSVRAISGGLLNSGSQRGGNEAQPAGNAPGEKAGPAEGGGDDAAGQEGGDAAGGEAGGEGEGEADAAEAGEGEEAPDEGEKGEGGEEAGEGDGQDVAGADAGPDADGPGPDGNAGAAGGPQPGPAGAGSEPGPGQATVGGTSPDPGAPVGFASGGGLVSTGGGLFSGGATGLGPAGPAPAGGLVPGAIGPVPINPVLPPPGSTSPDPITVVVDPVQQPGAGATLTGGAGNDSLVGDAGNNTLFGNGGNDTLNAGAGNDLVFGGAGDDVIIGGSGAGNDSYDGGAGTDTLKYTSTSLGIIVDTANGTASGSEIDSDTFSQIEIIIGGNGADTFKGGPASFSFDGGLGIDTLDYQTSTSILVVNLGTGNATGADIGTDTFAGFEKVIGGIGNDVLIGNSGANTLNGSDGADTLDGGAGNDRLAGDAGDDFLAGGIGSDTYLGGAGADTLSFLTLSEGISMNVGAGTVVDLGGTLGVNGTFSGVESFVGTSFNDTIIGGAGNDVIDGGDGIDVVQGGAGDDSIGFDTSTEIIDGGAGEDKLRLFGANQFVDSSNLANVTSVEIIDLGGVGSNTFTVDEILIQAVSGTGILSVFGNGDDSVVNVGSFDLAGSVAQGTLTLDSFENGAATLNTAVSIFENFGTINFAPSAAFSNTMLNHGALTTSDGTYTNNGLIVLESTGSIDMTGATTLAGAGVFLNQGSIALQNDTIAGVLDGGIGTLGLQDTITIDGTLIFGPTTEIDGVGTITLAGAGTLVNLGTHDIDDAPSITVDTVVNQGDFVFSTLTPTITSATIDNQAGALLEFQVASTIDMVAGQTLSNAGILRLSSAPLDFLDGIIENAGTLDVVAATSTLNVTNGTVSMLAGGELTGAGTVALASADFEIAAGAGFTLGVSGSGPSLNILGGNITGAGTFVNESEVIIDNASSIDVAAFTNRNGGVLDHADGLLTVSSGVFDNQIGGLVRVDTQTSTFTAMDFTNDIVNAGVIEFFGSNAGEISVGGGSGTLVNAGTGGIFVTDGDHVLNGELVNTAGGVVSVNAQGAALARLSHEASFTNDGFLHLTTGASGSQTAIFNQGTGFTLSNTGTIAMDGGIAGDLVELSSDFDNSGTLVVNFAGESRLVPATGFDAVMVNSGTIEISGASDFSIGISGATGNTDFTNSGVIDLAAGGRLNLLQNTLTHTGILNIGTGSSLNIEADSILNLDVDFTLNAGATISVGDGSTSPVLGGTGTLTNQGLVQLVDGTLAGNLVNDAGAILIQGVNNLNAGTLSFDNNATLGFLSSTDKFSNNNLIDINNSSILTVDTGTLHNLSGGIINVFAAGTIDLVNGAVFQDDGVTNFGASPGTLTIGGDMLRGDTSFMLFELGGLTPGIHDGFDQLTVIGDLSAGGTLDIVEFGGFEIAAGDSFDIIQAGTVSGSFREIAGLDVGGGVVLDAQQSATGITLVGRTVTHQGTTDDDTLTGTAGDDVFVGDSGNDFILGGGGFDLMHGGDGDDVFVAADTGFGRIDGGAGMDTVRFDSGGFDLTMLRGDQFSNIERLDLTAAGNSTLTLDGDFAFAATGGVNALTGAAASLIIDGDSGDALTLQGGMTNTGTVTIGGNGYSVFESGDNAAQVFIDSDIAVSLS